MDNLINGVDASLFIDVKRFEYQVISYLDSMSAVTDLNMHGQGGWDIVQVFEQSKQILMKREI